MTRSTTTILIIAVQLASICARASSQALPIIVPYDNAANVPLVVEVIADGVDSAQGAPLTNGYSQGQYPGNGYTAYEVIPLGGTTSETFSEYVDSTTPQEWDQNEGTTIANPTWYQTGQNNDNLGAYQGQGDGSTLYQNPNVNPQQYQGQNVNFDGAYQNLGGFFGGN